MNARLPTLAGLVALAIASGPTVAQEQSTETTETAPAATATEDTTTATGDAATATPRDAAQEGEPYLVDSFTDWALRCVRIDNIDDPCEIHQALNDTGGVRTAEINIFPLVDGQVAAGATIVTPLETLLPRGVRMSVDGGQVKEYPFTFCNRVGCVAQVGFTSEEIESFKRGSKGVVSIFPVAAPDQVVNLDLSLAGFTAAFTAILEAGGTRQ